VTDEAASDLTLLDVLTGAADDLPLIRRADEGSNLIWSTGGVAFAALDGDRAEFRLDPRVAGAALRTPDTAPSARGRDWVAFAPLTLDDTAVDRAEAWFLSAHRRSSAPRPSS
jgi:hypothetical protein